MLNRIATELGVRPYLTTFDELSHVVGRLDATERSRLMRMVDESIAGDSGHPTEELRVGTTKVLLSLLPESADRVKDILQTTVGRNVYEWHFSLFCYLDQVANLKRAREFAVEIPAVVEQYLYHVRVESAHAAWMAGDLMGDHWEADEATPVLIRSLKNARFVAGRKGAIHGLSHVLRRISVSGATDVVAAFRAAAGGDRSREVRRESTFVLDRYT